MLSALYYLLLVLLCTLFMILSALALVVCYPFDRGSRTVHVLSRILVRIFFFLPPFWRQRVIGRELIDRKKSYVIVINHNTVIDIPALYYIPLNFRWVSKREVFKTPFFGQFLLLHGDICIDRGHAAEALEQLVRDTCDEYRSIYESQTKNQAQPEELAAAEQAAESSILFPLR